MNGNGIFNAQILVDKLAKLNSSQQSIETLSHWCIFHMKKAKQVVETWERQFHCSPRDQRVSFLYLANDILQNSRRKGLEFVSEFWKVLPNALNDVVQNGDESGRKAALRLVDIWDDRKVFGSRGQVLKEDLLANRNRNAKSITYKLKPSVGGDMVEKLISGYDNVNDGPVDDVIFGKCRTAISFIEKLEKESGDEFNLGNIGGPGVLEELQGQHGVLRESIEQLKLAESSRSTLLSHLTEALHEQEFKIEQVRNQLQVAESRYEQVERLLSGQMVLPLSKQQLNEVSPPPPPPSSFSEVPPPPDYPPESPTPDMALSSPINYTQQHPQVSYVDTTSPHTTNEEHRKTSAAEVAAKLTASTSSAQMLSYVLSSLSSNGVIGQSMNEDHPSDGKRPRLNNGGLSSVPCYMPQPQQPPPPPFPHPDSFQPLPPPLPPSVSPIPPPLPISAPASPQFGQSAGSMTSLPYTYGSPLPPSQLPPYPMVGMPPYPGPPNPFTFQGSDNSVHFSQQPLMAAPPPMPRQ